MENIKKETKGQAGDNIVSGKEARYSRGMKSKVSKGQKGVKPQKSKGGLRVKVVPLKNPMEGSDTPKFKLEAKDVDDALKRSFGKIISETSARYKASYSLIRSASHWGDGDSKKLVMALAHRYQSHHLLKEKFTPSKKKLVSSPRNSKCGTAKFKDLDWNKGWWTDDSFGMHYLHVHHKDGETIHRVYCRSAERPRLQVTNGKLYWLY